MNLYQILSLCGTSSLIISLISVVFAKMKKEKLKTETIQLGVQALLRAELIKTYEEYKQKGFAPIYVKDNFENCYNRYHNLGANGVMDQIHEEFLNLPTQKQEDVQ